ncbi:MAG: hypothetical protein IPJ77_00310 [Planctomycetes bacterium]|nr:hypothetical protein [Planctomycetota bacterium]
MKSLLLPSLLLVQTGGSGGPPPNPCSGCDDTSQVPLFVETQTGTCMSYTTAELTVGRDGTCSWNGSACSPDPCHPELVLRNHQSSNGDGVYVSGIIGDVKFGPIKFPGSQDTEIYRGGITLSCGGSSPYFFEIVGDCVDPDTIEEVHGQFSCSSCVPR